MIDPREFMQLHLKLDATPGNTAFMTYNGHPFDLFNPESWVFDIDDIAQALSNTCRFGGHANFYSVAEHCVRVSIWLKEHGYDEKTQFLGLLHDSIEAYIGDIVRPIKKKSSLDGEPITELEQTLEWAFFNTFDGLIEDYDEQWANVKKGDWAIFELERAERPDVGRGLAPNTAKDVFMSHYHRLSSSLGVGTLNLD